MNDAKCSQRIAFTAQEYVARNAANEAVLLRHLDLEAEKFLSDFVFGGVSWAIFGY